MNNNEYPIRLRARMVDGALVVKALLTHPMNNGLTADTAAAGSDPGSSAIAHFITEITVHINDELAARVDTGSGVAANPLFGWRFSGAKAGDKVRVSWQDNQGLTNSAEAVVS